jgi:hypothetical protein
VKRRYLFYDFEADVRELVLHADSLRRHRDVDGSARAAPMTDRADDYRAHLRRRLMESRCPGRRSITA